MFNRGERIFFCKKTKKTKKLALTVGKLKNTHFTRVCVNSSFSYNIDTYVLSLLFANGSCEELELSISLVQHLPTPVLY